MSKSTRNAGKPWTGADKQQLKQLARGNTPKPDHLAETGALADASQAQRGTRPAYWGEGFVDTPVFDGARLGEGATVEGPALIEEPYTVVVLPPDATATLDGLGNYVVSA